MAGHAWPSSAPELGWGCPVVLPGGGRDGNGPGNDDGLPAHAGSPSVGGVGADSLPIVPPAGGVIGPVVVSEIDARIDRLGQ